MSGAEGAHEAGYLRKPRRVFDRDREWRGLTAFVASPPAGSGATLAVVSGRRRQGKSYLLQALCEATEGLYFAATEATEAESLRLFSDALIAHTHEGVDPPFRDWNDAVIGLFRRLRDRPRPVVLDEFPFLSRVSPALPSIIQRELGPGGSGQQSSVRLILCGSAVSVMGGLLRGSAPLRGRAGLELVVQPFGYVDAARFWGITDPRLAVLVHAVVGGTPAYRQELTRGDTPSDVDDFDPWVVRTVLSPLSPLFREARYLLAEEADIRDTAMYHSVLAAVAYGNNTNGGIASYVGRRSDQITHPLAVLEDCALISREPDLLRAGRVRYRIVEPILAFYEAVMRRRWAELELDRGAPVWSSQRQTFLSQVVGPHFEQLCREFALTRGATVFREPPGEVGSGSVNDAAQRHQIEVDVVALGPQEPGRARRVISLGEAKWSEVMGAHHLQRLTRARDLLASKGYDVGQTTLACYSASGFTDELRRSRTGDVLLVDPPALYAAAP